MSNRERPGDVSPSQNTTSPGENSPNILKWFWILGAIHLAGVGVWNSTEPPVEPLIGAAACFSVSASQSERFRRYRRLLGMFGFCGLVVYALLKYARIFGLGPFGG